MDVTLLAPAGTVYVAFARDVVDVVSDQTPDDGDWTWAMDILDAAGMSDIPPALLFDLDLDVWRYPRTQDIPMI